MYVVRTNWQILYENRKITYTIDECKIFLEKYVSALRVRVMHNVKKIGGMVLISGKKDHKGRR